MIEIKFYGDDPATIRKQIFELFGIIPKPLLDALTPTPAKAPTVPKATPQPDAPNAAPPWVQPAIAPVETPATVTKAPAAVEAPAEAVNPSMLRELLGNVSERLGSAALAKLLDEFGVKQFSKIPPEQYGQVKNKALTLMGGAPL